LFSYNRGVRRQKTRRDTLNSEKSIIEIMRNRQSTRTYDAQPITQAHYHIIQEYIHTESHLIGPFGNKGRIAYVQVTDNVTDKGIKLGTYGFIKNPKAYLVGVTENTKYALVEYAHTFHKLTLHLAGIGIGTCWMGGTFNRNSFEQEIQLQEGEFIPCITPVGYPKEKTRLFDKALRFAVKADNKKAWDSLFYETNFENNLEKREAGLLETPLEMVRLGPSASNKQPWRLVVSPDRTFIHFFIEHTPNYNKLGYDMQLLDMGIAMCQFELACNELQIKGEWLIEDPAIASVNEHIEYIVSWNFHR